jgi:hypothetical protein
MNKKQIVTEVVNKEYAYLDEKSKIPFESNYDGFCHCDLSGFIDEIINELEDENLEFNYKNISDMFFHLYPCGY